MKTIGLGDPRRVMTSFKSDDPELKKNSFDSEAQINAKRPERVAASANSILASMFGGSSTKVPVDGNVPDADESDSSSHATDPNTCADNAMTGNTLQSLGSSTDVSRSRGLDTSGTPEGDRSVDLGSSYDLTRSETALASNRHLHRVHILHAISARNVSSGYSDERSEVDVSGSTIAVEDYRYACSLTQQQAKQAANDMISRPRRGGESSRNSEKARGRGAADAGTTVAMLNPTSCRVIDKQRGEESKPPSAPPPSSERKSFGDILTASARLVASQRRRIDLIRKPGDNENDADGTTKPPATATAASVRRLAIQQRRLKILREAGNDKAARLFELAMGKMGEGESNKRARTVVTVNDGLARSNAPVDIGPSPSSSFVSPPNTSKPFIQIDNKYSKPPVGSKTTSLTVGTMSMAPMPADAHFEPKDMGEEVELGMKLKETPNEAPGVHAKISAQTKDGADKRLQRLRRVSELLDIKCGDNPSKSRSEKRASRLLRRYVGREELLVRMLEKSATVQNRASPRAGFKKVSQIGDEAWEIRENQSNSRVPKNEKAAAEAAAVAVRAIIPVDYTTWGERNDDKKKCVFRSLKKKSSKAGNVVASTASTQSQRLVTIVTSTLVRSKIKRIAKRVPKPSSNLKKVSGERKGNAYKLTPRKQRSSNATPKALSPLAPATAELVSSDAESQLSNASSFDSSICWGGSEEDTSFVAPPKYLGITKDYLMRNDEEVHPSESDRTPLFVTCTPPRDACDADTAYVDLSLYQEAYFKETSY